MIPRLDFTAAAQPITLQFLEQLSKTKNFQGEISSDYATRLMSSTDNSVYQVLPQAIIFPKSSRDIEAIFLLAHRDVRFHAVSFTARGGGTGTNGQSLATGIVIDCSKYMRRILEVNREEAWVLVEPGVVLDQLNQDLKPLGVFFAPTLSPSNRATLGGMTNTDACGKGSRLYGKTSEHVLEITAVYSDGASHTSKAIELDELANRKMISGCVGEAYTQVDKTVSEHQETIDRVFPKLKRFMTGYNLAHVYSPDRSTFNLNAILTGSEGTLAVVTQIKLKLTPIPKCKALVVSQYHSFDDALRDGVTLAASKPAAIETIDETVLGLAKTDLIYDKVKRFLNNDANIEVAAINLIEFIGKDRQTLEDQLTALPREEFSLGRQIVFDEEDIANLWTLRKKSVGLLANTKGRRKPISGMEDTVVPPEQLPAFVKAFRALLDSHGLQYGMFGHIDAGCLHVRPAFDLSDPKDETLFLELSDKVAQLTQEFGGLMWGEHGKGYRSRYVPMFFGEELYPELQKIKAAFDPFNQLNPGKIATTPDASTHLLEVKGPLRGHFDRQIESSLREKNTIVLSCDGNGACFNYEVNDFMCPSYKVTKDRLHSPKGRAALVREWLRQLSASKKKVRFPLHRLFNGFGKRLGAYDYSHEVYRSMQGCLACKACTTQCPVHIDVPSFRSRFLEQYHGRYMRSLSDYLIAHSEKITYYQQHFPSFSNWLFQRSLTRFFLKKFAGLVDTPLLATPNIKRCFSKNKIPYVDISVLSQLDKPQKEKTLVIIQDWVTSFYEPPLVVAFYEFLTKLGYDVYMIPWFPNGKPLHLKGYLKRFKRVAEENCKQLQAIDRLGITLLGVDPSMLLTFRHEYPELLGKASVQFKIHLIQEWFADQLANSAFNRPHLSRNGKEYLLLSHCTEKTAQVQTDHLWRRIFEAFGLKLKLVNTGCCGMAGSYGHERLHQKESKQLFAMSWQTHMPTASEEKAEILVTGYSCRSQVRRLTSLKPKHPIELLNSLLE